MSRRPGQTQSTEGVDQLWSAAAGGPVDALPGQRGPWAWAGLSRSGLRGVAHVHAAVFLEVDKPKPVVLFELAKGWLTGERVEPGEIHELRQPHR